MPRKPTQLQTARRRRRGFTLIEAALVTSIISFGVMAMLQLLATGTASNAQGQELTTGVNLARSIREMSLGLAFADPQTPAHWGPETGETLAGYDDLDDLDGAVFSPPIDALRQSAGLDANWKQTVVVQTVDPNLLTSAVPKGTEPTARVTVTITHNGRSVCDLSWTVFDASR